MLPQALARKIDEHPADTGCEAATRYLREKGNNESSYCSECPFDFCIIDIRNQTKQLLKNSEIIEDVFKLNKQEKPFCEICELYHEHSPHTIRNWLTHQPRIQKTINKFRWAIPHLKL